MSVLVFYFGVAGLLPFTILLWQTARTTVRRLREPAVSVGGVAVCAAFLAVCAAVDTGFVALLVRALMIAAHPPALS